MTIAIGVLAKDGLVMAADTQISSGYEKTTLGKIAYVPSFTGGSSSAFTAAGTVGYMDALLASEINLFRSLHAELSIEEVERNLSDHFVEFHAKHVLPFGHYPFQERPGVDLLIGAHWRGERRIWSTSNNAFVPRYNYAAIGIGEMHARVLLGQLWHDEADATSIALLAAYVIFQVKQNVEGCGHDTDIWVLRGDRSYKVDRKKVRDLEEQFREYTYISSLLCEHITKADHLEIDKERQRLIGKLGLIREEIASIGIDPKR